MQMFLSRIETARCSLWKKHKFWVEHFKGVLNQPDAVITYDITSAVARKDNENIRMDDILSWGNMQSNQGPEKNKTSCTGEISPELLKYVHNIIVKQLMKLFNHILKKKIYHQNAKKGTSVIATSGRVSHFY